MLQHHLLKRPSFPIELFLHTCPKSLGCTCVRLDLQFPFCVINLHASLCKYHNILIKLQLKKKKFLPLSFFKTVLSLPLPLHFYINFRTILSMSIKSLAETSIGTALTHIPIWASKCSLIIYRNAIDFCMKFAS